MIPLLLEGQVMVWKYLRGKTIPRCGAGQKVLRKPHRIHPTHVSLLKKGWQGKGWIGKGIFSRTLLQRRIIRFFILIPTKFVPGLYIHKMSAFLSQWRTRPFHEVFVSVPLTINIVTTFYYLLIVLFMVFDLILAIVCNTCFTFIWILWTV